jgi:hypothetical protein
LLRFVSSRRLNTSYRNVSAVVLVAGVHMAVDV